MTERDTISKQARLARILSLKMRGLRVASITKMMRDEGFKVSDRTIQRILVSHSAKEMADELVYQQLEDLTRADVPLRLKWRADLLKWLSPPENKLELTGNLPLQIVFSDGMKDVVKPTSTDTGKV